jgi:hypothetical protein
LTLIKRFLLQQFPTTTAIELAEDGVIETSAVTADRTPD